MLSTLASSVSLVPTVNSDFKSEIRRAINNQQLHLREGRSNAMLFLKKNKNLSFIRDETFVCLVQQCVRCRVSCFGRQPYSSQGQFVEVPCFLSTFSVFFSRDWNSVFRNHNASTHCHCLVVQDFHDDSAPLKVLLLFASTHSRIAVTEGQGNLTRYFDIASVASCCEQRMACLVLRTFRQKPRDSHIAELLIVSVEPQPR